MSKRKTTTISIKGAHKTTLLNQLLLRLDKLGYDIVTVGFAEHYITVKEKEKEKING
jgi:molybdopterin-guanine dinucleotide biosynthesis protein